MEPTSGREIGQVGRLAARRFARPSRDSTLGIGNGGDEEPGIGVHRLLCDLFRRPVLHELATRYSDAWWRLTRPSIAWSASRAVGLSATVLTTCTGPWPSGVFGNTSGRLIWAGPAFPPPWEARAGGLAGSAVWEGAASGYSGHWWARSTGSTPGPETSNPTLRTTSVPSELRRSCAPRARRVGTTRRARSPAWSSRCGCSCR